MHSEQGVSPEEVKITSCFQEFWLVATFGVIVAIHATRESTIFRLKLMISFLYSALTVFALLDTIGSFMQIDYLFSLIENDLFDPAQLSNTPAMLASVLRLALYLVGSVIVLIFIFKYDLWHKGESN